MPSVSKAQFGYMKAIQSGSIPAPKGLSRSKAAEYTRGSHLKTSPIMPLEPLSITKRSKV